MTQCMKSESSLFNLITAFLSHATFCVTLRFESRFVLRGSLQDIGNCTCIYEDNLKQNFARQRSYFVVKLL